IVPGWDVIEVESTVAAQIHPMIEASFQRPVRLYDDIFYLLDTSLEVTPDYDKSIEIRLLNINDLPIVKAAHPDLYPNTLGTLEKTLSHAIVAGAIVDKRLVAFCESRAADKHV